MFFGGLKSVLCADRPCLTTALSKAGLRSRVSRQTSASRRVMGDSRLKGNSQRLLRNREKFAGKNQSRNSRCSAGECALDGPRAKAKLPRATAAPREGGLRSLSTKRPLVECSSLLGLFENIRCICFLGKSKSRFIPSSMAADDWRRASLLRGRGRLLPEGFQVSQGLGSERSALRRGKMQKAGV